MVIICLLYASLIVFKSSDNLFKKSQLKYIEIRGMLKPLVNSYVKLQYTLVKP